ncbi:hypothetical protein Q8A67_021112 [Cirrhinus molitorella]|uniref:Uncharacterized protein n=1 Tax=Cirrhinus molitorella TaxID=172907 RepID=A0AA88PD29_9TELE|nr:hypothetical protein Q8A67_021112 [Cirrhinus molitorella]
MDPPENSVNRFGRTIWTVWGYLSGAVARYLRPEVTEDGNQSVRARTDDIGLKSAVNKVDREVKANNGDDEEKKAHQNDSTEIKCSPSRVRVQVASVQWQNTDVVKDDNNDELHVRTAKKQTRHCVTWSDTDNDGNKGDEKEIVSSNEVQTEKVRANTECEERETAQETENIEQQDGQKEETEECDLNREDEEYLKRRKDADNADVTVQSEQDVEQEKQMNVTDHAETEGIAGFKLADEYLVGEKEKIVDQKVQEKAENDEEQGLDSQDLLPQMKPFTEEADDLERLQVTTKYSDENVDVSKNKAEEVMPETGNAVEQDKENKNTQDLEESEQLEQKDDDCEDEECDLNHEDEKSHMTREDPDSADVMVQSELNGQDAEQEMQISLMDHAETEGIAGFKLADEYLVGEKEKIVDQKDQEKAENDEDQGTESQIEYCTEEADDLPKDDRLEVITKYSDQNVDISKNEAEEMISETGSASEQDKENENTQELEESRQLEQKDGENEDEECDLNHEDEKSHMTREDPDNTDIMVQYELYGQDAEQEMQISLMDHAETENVGGFKLADEHLVGEKEKIVDQKDQEKAENDEEQGLDSQDLLPQMKPFTEEADDLERLQVTTKYSDENVDVSKNEAEEVMPETGNAAEQDKENKNTQELEESEQLEQKDDDSEDEECDLNHEDEKSHMTREDPDNTDVMVQSELNGQDAEQEMQISLMDHAETENVGGFEHADEHPTDEKEKIVDQKDQEITEKHVVDQEITENDEDQGTESQMEYCTEEADDLAKPERLKAMEKYSDEINEFSKEGVEEMMLGTEQDQDTTESEQNVTKYELTASAETLQRVSEELSEKNAPNDEPELKMTTVDETVDALEDTLLSHSKRDTSENTPETGTGSPLVSEKTEGMFSDLIVCQFTGELRKGPETALAETDLRYFEDIKTNLRNPPAEEQSEREAVVACSVEHSESLKAFQTEQDTETVIESSGATENQEMDKTEVSLKERAELRTELIAETIEAEIGSEDEEAEVFEKESRSPVVRNVTLQTRELPEFTEGQCKSSQGTMNPFNEAQGNSSVSEIAGTAEIDVAEDQTDVKPVSTSPAEFLEESLDLHGESETDVALEYVEEIKIQVLKERTETELNTVQKTEPLAGFSTEEPGDAENQGAARCVSADVFVLEEERKLLVETMDSRLEMETASGEVVKQNEHRISSPECETTKADGRREHTQKSIAGETASGSHEDLMEVSRSAMKRGFDQVSKELKTEGRLDLSLQALDSSLDFTVQKARIAVKNPLVRPPKDPRKLLSKASLEPLLPQTSPRGQKVEVSAPCKGVIGFKLPGLGAGFPVLRKTEFGQKAREGGEAERTLQPQTSAAVTEDSVKQEQVPAKPKWTPPKHPGMGGPFMMAELKSKLKKPVQE